MTRSTLIHVIDQLGEVRDLNTVALMACDSLADREARKGFSRLLAQISNQLNAIDALLNEANGEAGDEPV